jgi:hypothetical protein
MGYDTKSIEDLEELAAHLREQIKRNPELVLERIELIECEAWISECRRQGEGPGKGGVEAA